MGPYGILGPMGPALWSSVGPYEAQWGPMGLYGALWGPVGLRGFL